jgi:hypothetical protein
MTIIIVFIGCFFMFVFNLFISYYYFYVNGYYPTFIATFIAIFVCYCFAILNVIAISYQYYFVFFVHHYHCPLYFKYVFINSDYCLIKY